MIILTCLWSIPILQVQFANNFTIRPEDSMLENEYRKTLIQIIGGIVIIVGLYLNWRRIVSTENAITISERGQLVDRLSKAVDQIGSNNLSVRIGGLYALKNIGFDFENYTKQVVEILSSFIRVNSSVDAACDESVPVPHDVQIALDSIIHIKSDHNEFLDNTIIDLSGCRLMGITIIKKNLKGFDFSRSNLSNSNLESCQIANVEMFKTNFSNCNLSKINIFNAKLKNCVFDNSQMSFSILSKLLIFDSSFRNCSLVEANFRGSAIDNVSFKDSTLMDADFTDTHMDNCDFSGAKFVSNFDYNNGNSSNTKLFSKPKGITERHIKYNNISSELFKSN